MIFITIGYFNEKVHALSAMDDCRSEGQFVRSFVQVHASSPLRSFDPMAYEQIQVGPDRQTVMPQKPIHVREPHEMTSHLLIIHFNVLLMASQRIQFFYFALGLYDNIFWKSRKLSDMNTKTIVASALSHFIQ